MSLLSHEQLDRLFDPLTYLDVADGFIDRVLGAHAASGTRTRG